MARRQRGAGLSLVELLVALAIGSVLSFGALNLFLFSKLSYLQDEALARLGENGRYALRYLTYELTMAGFLGRLLPGELNMPSANGSACFDYLLQATPALEHLDDVSAAGATAAGTGVPADCLLPGRHRAGTDILLIRRTAASPTRHRGEPSGAADADTVYLHTPARAAGGGLQRGGDQLQGLPDLWEYRPQVVFIRNYSVRPGDGIPTLCRRRLARTANRMGPTACLIEGIENLQLEFGLDTDGDLRADRFEARPDRAQLRTAVAARLYLLVRSVFPVSSHVEDRSYTLGSTVVRAANDGYYRRVLQATVLLRNTGTFSR